MVSNETSSALNSEQDLASIPTAQGGLSRLAMFDWHRAGVGQVIQCRAAMEDEVVAIFDLRASAGNQVEVLPDRELFAIIRGGSREPVDLICGPITAD